MNHTNDPKLGHNRDRNQPRRPAAPSRSQLGLYAGFGLAGAAVGVVSGELISRLLDFALKALGASFLSESFTAVLLTALRLGVFASSLGFALLLARARGRRRDINARSAADATFSFFLAGAAAGGLAQTLYNGWSDSRESQTWVVDAASWVLLGALLGVIISRIAPRLPTLTASAAGLLTGVLASILRLLLTAWDVQAVVGSTCGLIVFGAVMGLLMSLLEKNGQEAVVEVHWSAKDITTVGIGEKPITVGGGTDDIYLDGAPPRVSTIAMDNGVIEHIETSTGTRTTLKDGSRLRIGGLVMVVHAPN